MIVQLCTGRKLNGLYLWLGIRLGFHQVVFEPHPKKLTVYLVPIGNNFFPLFLFPTVNLEIKLVLFLKAWNNVVFRTWFHGIIRMWSFMKRLYFLWWNQSNFEPCRFKLRVQTCNKSNRTPQIKNYFFSLIFSIWCKVLNCHSCSYSTTFITK